jgi:hypothetical protein
MRTPQKRVLTVPTRKQPKSVRSPAKRHATPTTPGEQHIGATEDQVSRTMPPKTDDDEPKQG